MIGIVLRCDYPLCPEERQLSPSTGPWAELDVSLGDDVFYLDSAGIAVPEGWSIDADGRCRCAAHADAELPEPPTEADTA